MTKFEEELFYKVPCKFEITTEAEYKKSTLINHFKNWHSDEEFQEHFIANKNLIDVNTKLAEEIANLKSQLQQQALPVVPSFVADWYEEKKNKLELAVYKINTLIDKKSFNDLTKIEKWFEGVENKPIETIFKMKDGYTVEKPQLFYLKNKITGNVLVYDESPELSEVSELFATGGEFELENYTFTQSEIDSMETGSYKQIKVAE